jgi:hypothetical protein
MLLLHILILVVIIVDRWYLRVQLIHAEKKAQEERAAAIKEVAEKAQELAARTAVLAAERASIVDDVAKQGIQMTAALLDEKLDDLRKRFDTVGEQQNEIKRTIEDTSRIVIAQNVEKQQNQLEKAVESVDAIQQAAESIDKQIKKVSKT